MSNKLNCMYNIIIDTFLCNLNIEYLLYSNKNVMFLLHIYDELSDIKSIRYKIVLFTCINFTLKCVLFKKKLGYHNNILDNFILLYKVDCYHKTVNQMQFIFFGFYLKN